MAGATFLANQTKTEPGVFFRTRNASDQAVVALQNGVVAALFKATWGPMNEVVDITTQDQAALTFGTTSGAALLPLMLASGARVIRAIRVGTGGAKATKNLMDTESTPGVGVVVTAKYFGTTGNLKLTVRNDPADATKRQLLVYNDTVEVERFSFNASAAGSSEPADLIAAVAAQTSDYIVVTDGAGTGLTLATVTSTAMASGADPTASITEYTAGMAVAEPEDVRWNILALDSENSSTQVAAQTFVNRVREDGKRVLLVVGEPTSVSLATRLTNAAAFNNLATMYVLNGFQDTSGATIDGAKAAAVFAGMLAGAGYNESMTHRIVPNASRIVGSLTITNIRKALDAGAIVFNLSAAGLPQVVYGITTLVTTTNQLDAGWKKIRRVRERDTLLERVGAALEPMVGRVNNTNEGRVQITSTIVDVINQMVREGALLANAKVQVDSANAPSGDAAWFDILVDDIDSVEHIYATFGFRFSPPA